MSKKSQLWQQKDGYRSPVLNLHQRVKNIRTAKEETLGLSCVFLVVMLAYVLLVFTRENIEDIYAIAALCLVPFCAVFLYFLKMYILSRKVYRILSSIQYIHEESVKIRCKKASFLYRSVSKHSSIVVCTCLQDMDNHIYYCVYPEFEAPRDFQAKSLRSKLKGKELRLTLYQGTPAIMAIHTEIAQ